MTAPIRLNATGGSARASTLGSSAAGLGNAVTDTVRDGIPGGAGSFGPLPLPERWVLPAAARLGEARTAVVARGACACDGTGGPRGSNLCGLAALRDRLAGGVLPPALRALAALDMTRVRTASHAAPRRPRPCYLAWLLAWGWASPPPGDSWTCQRVTSKPVLVRTRPCGLVIAPQQLRSLNSRLVGLVASSSLKRHPKGAKKTVVEPMISMRR